MTLEVRCDNAQAIRFYERSHYRIMRTLKDYYEDGSAGFKMAKKLVDRSPRRIRLPVPYYAQTLEFTCGPACIMMALKHFLPDLDLVRTLEMTLWKEATLIFTASGIGGTGPHGLALAAARRGLQCRLIASKDSAPFLNSVRSEKKREVITLVHNDIKRQARDARVASAAYEYVFEDIISALYHKFIPVPLISTYRLTGDRTPHWVVVTGFDKDSVFIHDPDERSYRRGRSQTRNIRIDQTEFMRMTRYGKDVYRCLVMIGPPVRRMSR